MKRKQERFIEFTPQEIGNNPLSIHEKSDAKSNTIILFVHGLGGKSYGKKSTWGNFPKFLFEDFKDCDIGLYHYSTLSERLFTKSISLKEEADVFATTIRDELKQYEAIILIGHSMGGILCKAVISSLIDNNYTDALSRINGLFLLATPQLGSLKVPGWLSFLSSDLQALKAHNDFLNEITKKLETHVCNDINILPRNKKTTIQTWAVLAAEDIWVDRMSAGIGIASTHKKITRGTHTAIVKPHDKSNPIYVWISNAIHQCIKPYIYDVFIASAMAAHSSNDDYTKSREAIIKLQKVLVPDHTLACTLCTLRF